MKNKTTPMVPFFICPDFSGRGRLFRLYLHLYDSFINQFAQLCSSLRLSALVAIFSSLYFLLYQLINYHSLINL
jgi:hypothetical protein